MGRGFGITLRDRLIVYDCASKGITSPAAIKRVFDEADERPIGLDSIRKLIGEFEEFKRLLPEYPSIQEALMMGNVKYEEGKEFLALLRRWREQLQFLSVDQLLRQFYLDNWRRDLEHELTESEEVSHAYFQAWGRHWATIPKPYKAMLPVESEYSFKQLKELYPNAQGWKAQASWGEAYGMYWDAFSSWIVEVEYACELAMGFAMLEEGTNGDFDDKMRDARGLIKGAKRAKSDIWLFLRLLALAVACDLLRLGVGQEEPDASWALEVVVQIRELRHMVVDTSMKELPKDFWLTGRNNVHAATESLWDRYEPAKEKTIALLQALKRLHSAQNNVHDKLKALEHTLAS